jgi:hypothetical protein
MMMVLVVETSQEFGRVNPGRAFKLSTFGYIPIRAASGWGLLFFDS